MTPLASITVKTIVCLLCAITFLSCPPVLAAKWPPKVASELAQGYIKAGKYADAIVVLNDSLQADPNWTDGYIQRAAAEFGEAKFASATEDYSRAIALKPKDKLLYSLRGSARLYADDVLGAIEDYTQAIQLDPNSGEYYYDRALAYSNLRKTQLAVGDISKAIQIQPKVSNYLMRAGLRLLLDDKKGAMEDFKQVACSREADLDSKINANIALCDRSGLFSAVNLKLAHGPDYYAYVIRAQVYSHRKQFQQAQADCDKAIANNAQKPEAFDVRGSAEIKSGQTQSGINDLSKSIALDPEDVCEGEQYFFRAQGYVRLGKTDLAARDKAIASRLGYNSEQDCMTDKQLKDFARKLTGQATSNAR
ncbi:MAG TPA: tetratricopeptide repeat protein [Candidatus Obscuribacterales bacterium]